MKNYTIVQNGSCDMSNGVNIIKIPELHVRPFKTYSKELGYSPGLDYIGMIISRTGFIVFLAEQISLESMIESLNLFYKYNQGGIV